MLDTIKELRLKTNAGIVACKEALAEANGDIEKAVTILRKKGLSIAAKKSSRAANQGLVESYIHANGKIGVLIEVNCETDFVAKNEDFKTLVKELLLQIAAANPKFLSREDVPLPLIENEKDIIKEQSKGKPAHALEKIVEGKLAKFYEDNCLLDQVFIKDQSVKINQLITDAVAKIGENIVVKRFARFQLGEE